MLNIDKVFENISKGYDFYICLGDFLDEFYIQESLARRQMIENEPQNYNLPKYQEAFLASVVHKLANDFKLDVPGWVFNNKYYLYDEPYFDCNAKGKLRMLFMYISPSEFKHRNVFVDENILKRV